jgi:site-specific DNA-methyltransferase (adenine-specific)
VLTPNEVLDGTARWCVLEGDCITLDVPAESIDAVVSDPPAGIGFMGKDWDHHKGGRDTWIAWMAERMRVAFRLLKPGGHAVIWALPRTSHWTATAIEDAGFEIRDVLTHHFGSGFPKSLDVSKAIDSAAGAVREVVGGAKREDASNSIADIGALRCDACGNSRNGTSCQCTRDSGPATPEAAQWQGWGTALKPASEHWILARKPLIGTVAQNVLAHGTGGINVDACRVGTSKRVPGSVSKSQGFGLPGHETGNETGHDPNVGRWPTNLLLSHGEGCNGVCAPDCPVAELDRQSSAMGMHSAGSATAGRGVSNFDATSYTHGGASGRIGDSGGASRFYPTFRYVPKAPRAMREDGLRAAEGERGNDHPTVKHDNLMRWLCRLVTPPGGVVLDMFCGSGSTGRGALKEGFRFIGIDAEAHYVEIAEQRIAAVAPVPVEPEKQTTIFDLLARSV